MDTHQTPPARHASHHPLMIVAAIAVVLFCAVGTAAVLGWLPSSIGGTANRPLSDADRMALSAGMQEQNQPGAPAAPAALAAAAPAPAAIAGVAAPARAAATPAPQPLAQTYTPAAAYAPQPAPAVQPAPVAAPAYEQARGARAVQVAAADRPGSWCGNCGNIESIRTITSRSRGSGVGAVGGAVLGGILGHQVGSGSGRTLATAAGAVGGAVVGNQVEGNMHQVRSYEIRVRLDDGTLRTFHQSSPPSWHTGERVRIVKGHLRRY